MTKTIITAVSAIAVGLGVAIAAQAGEQARAETLPPTYIIHQLVGQGYDVREVELEDGVYEAKVRSAEGRIVKIEIDPVSGAILSPATVAAAPGSDPAAAVDAATAIQAVALEKGYWDIRELDWKNGAYRIKARDDAGNAARFMVDAKSGQLQVAETRD